MVTNLNPLDVRRLAAIRGYRSLAELARASGVSPSYVYLIQSGYMPSESKLTVLAAALRCRRSTLLKAIRHDG